MTAERWIAKVCGLRTDADVASAAGADLIGFVSYPPSPRHLDDDRIVALCRALARPPGAVLVTVDRPRGEIEGLAREAGLDAVQLCGSERADTWRDAPLRVLRRVPVSADGRREIDDWCGVAELFVLDTPHGPGGRGESVDVDLAAELAALGPCLLAGGIGPDELERGRAEALAAAPFVGVDASSRLESSPGRKDPALVRRYIDAARAIRTRKMS